ncbi:DUF2971 domain-containing protein [Vibrio sp. St2]|uniref:DUF2971 domain-containing protein n=1 Tax=Vibrio sp. St2 TaxID=2853441 RepID=UPI00248F1D90|nr:DUF2971 domain-containing protein [Vibrio sp. St2]
MNVQDEGLLYRYRPYNENTLSEIVNNQLWHSHVRLLNDPFELPFQFDWEEINEKNLIKISRKINLLSEQKLQECYAKNLQGNTLELVKRLYQDQTTELETYTTKAFVCCFSKSDDQPLMWSHYAQGMTGLCIAYKKDNLVNNDVEPLVLKDVKYNSKVEKLSYKDIDSYVVERQDGRDMKGQLGLSVRMKMSLSAITHVYQKHTRWEYEGEVRSVLFAQSDVENEKSGLIETVADNAINHIVIGSKMSSTNKEVILALCRGRGIPVYVATPNRDTYSVEIDNEQL